MRKKLTTIHRPDELIVTMGEGNPGALSLLIELFSKDSFAESVHIILIMDDMNIRGEQVWVAYKDHCNCDLKLLKNLVLKRDQGLVDTVNKRMPWSRESRDRRRVLYAGNKMTDEQIEVMKQDPRFIRAVRHLHFWQYGSNPDNFTSLLYLMFQKADMGNRANLARGFPFEYLAWQEWNDSPTQDAFFRKYGLPDLEVLYTQKLPPDSL